LGAFRIVGFSWSFGSKGGYGGARQKIIENTILAFSFYSDSDEVGFG